MAFHHPSNCEKNRKLLIHMVKQGRSLTQIAKVVQTNRRHVKAFLEKNGVKARFQMGSPGSKHPNWKGGRILDKNGYVLIHSPDHPFATRGAGSYVLAHRLVMEYLLGRYLQKHEVVHHKNGNKQDNNPQNLELFQTNGEHLKSELSGKTPKWTDQGIDRMKEGIAQSAKLRRPETHVLSGRDVREWR